MRKSIAASTLAAALLITSVSAASAWDEGYYRDDHRGPGPVLGFFGQVLSGVLTIATAPLALIPGIERDGHRDRYYEGHYYEDGAYAVSPEAARDYYGAGARYYGPPPRLYAYGER
jgi:hypothetical protein